MVTDQLFGGNWTEDKLERVKKYLSAYTKIMNKHPFKFAYIDAFAGTGYRELGRENEQQGYLYPELVDADFEEYADANSYITDLCTNYNWKKHRAVMFLDPFGMQVTWDTICVIW